MNNQKPPKETRIKNLAIDKQWEIEQLKFGIAADMRKLEAIIGMEALKDFIKTYPVFF